MKKKETFNIHGKNLVDKVKELIDEGNITSISIADKAGKVLVTFPLTIGVVAAFIAPVLAAVGAIAVFVGECSIIVEREVKEGAEEDAPL